MYIYLPMNDDNNDVQILTPVEGTSESETITNLIQNYLSQIATNREELKKARQMLADGFENDPVYREHAEKAKEANKIKSGTRAQIMKQPALMALKAKIKEMSEEVKTANEALSDYLQQYQKLTGLNSFETPDGKVKQIVYMAKLVNVGGER